MDELIEHLRSFRGLPRVADFDDGRSSRRPIFGRYLSPFRSARSEKYRQRQRATGDDSKSRMMVRS